MSNLKPLFICFEGIEGMGKSTHLRFMSKLLKSLGINLCLTREPGGTPLGEEIRNILLNSVQAINPMAELLLIMAARAQHVNQFILPALQAGQWVLCDRFMDTSFAYQGGGRGISIQDIENLSQITHPNLTPDYVFIFDAPVEVGMKRIKKRMKIDRFEQEKVEFFARARQIFLERASLFPHRYKIIDASLPIPEIEQLLTDFVNNELLR
ncbi:MAG: thymidylate kinase [Francisellaceae bacterium]|nr:thymidylate kinase [Francisellaceae bacterium]